jgi:hypothetical protein
MSPERLAYFAAVRTGAGIMLNGVETLFARDKIGTRPVTEIFRSSEVDVEFSTLILPVDREKSNSGRGDRGSIGRVLGLRS